MTETAARPILCCRGCGRTKPAPDGDITDLGPAEKCEACPPWLCEKCGKYCAVGAWCSCWTMVADMSEAEYRETWGESDSNLYSLDRLRERKDSQS
jgi:hypothetical protein